jgi:hypothetical protein
MRRWRSSESHLSDSNNVDMADISLIIRTVTRDTVAPVLQSIAAKVNHLTVINTLNTPARQSISELTMEYEIALAINKILRLELKETRDVLGT